MGSSLSLQRVKNTGKSDQEDKMNVDMKPGKGMQALKPKEYDSIEFSDCVRK